MNDGPHLVALARSEDVAAIADLLETCPDIVNATDSNGATAMHYAAFNGHRDLVTLLIQNGASINMRDSEFGATPTGWAIEYLRTQNGLLGIEIEDLAFAIRRKDVAWVRRFLQRFPQLRHEHDEVGIPLAKMARESGNDEIASLFQDANRDA
ncbi:MAG: ankyrin repeat domain-containing protein [Rubripirellula sp.]